MEDKWIETGQSQSWDEQDVLVGRFVRVKTNVGAHSSNLYVIRKEDGSEIGVWGSTVINGRFEEIPVGSMIKIESLGEAKSKQGVKYKDYKIMYQPAKTDITQEELNSIFPPEE